MVVTDRFHRINILQTSNNDNIHDISLYWTNSACLVSSETYFSNNVSHNAMSSINAQISTLCAQLRTNQHWFRKWFGTADSPPLWQRDIVCVSKPGHHWFGNGSSPRHKVVIWTNAGFLLIGSQGTYFREIVFKIQQFLFKKMHLKMSSAQCQAFHPGLNVLKIVIRRIRRIIVC